MGKVLPDAGEKPARCRPDRNATSVDRLPAGPADEPAVPL